MNGLPQFYIARDELLLEELPTARIMRTLSEKEGKRVSGGVVLTNEKGSIKVSPSSRNSFRIYTEAHSFEAAEELCDYARIMIKTRERSERS